MKLDLVTKEDLEAFRKQLIGDLKDLLGKPVASKEKAWLKGSEVRKLLNISPNTLQNLRVAGKLSPSKIGGILYYKLQEVEALFDSQKVA